MMESFAKNSCLVHLRKVLIFQEIELSGSSNFSKEIFSYIPGNGNTEIISCIFLKESFFYISGNRNPEKIPYVSGNGTF